MPQRQPTQPCMDADACRAMATLFVSGFSPLQIMAVLAKQMTSNPRLVTACWFAVRQLEQGQSLALVMSQQRFFTHGQLLQVQIAEQSGKLAQTLMGFAHDIERQRERKRQLKSRLLLSIAVVCIASMLGLGLALAKGVSILPTLLSLMAILVLTRFLFWMQAVDKVDLLARIWQYDGLLNRVTWFRRFFELQWYGLLTMQLDAGIDPITALSQLKAVFPSKVLREQVRRCLLDLEKGYSLTAALTQAHLIQNHTLRQLLLVGERSGRLVPTLQHYLAGEQKKQDVLIDGYYEWIPRFYYLVVLSVILRVVV